MRRAVRIRLGEAEVRQLTRWAHDAGSNARRGRRAQMVLLAAAGWTNLDIGRELGVHPETVGLWRRRFVSNRLDGIRRDAPRSGHGARSDKVVRRLSSSGLPSPGTRPWTTRSLARRLGVSHMTVYRAWRAQRRATIPTVRPVVAPAAPRPESAAMEGVFLHPPRRAAVFQVTPISGSSPAPGAPTAGMQSTAGPIGPGLNVLFHQWKRSAACRSGSACSVAELLVFLRSVEERSTAATSFVVLYEGFSRAAERRVKGWTRAHPRFRPVRLRSNRGWFDAMRLLLAEAPADATRSPSDPLRPVTESLQSYLRSNPAAPAPFVWTAPGFAASADSSP